MTEPEPPDGRGHTAAETPSARHPEPTALYTSLSVPVMVRVTDPDGVCTFLSESWYDFTGQTPATGLGFGWLGAVHPDDQELAGETSLAANRVQHAFQLDYRLRRKDGVYRWAIDAATPHFGANGTFLGYIGSVIDITELKEAEAALRESEARYRSLFRSIDTGFCVIESVLDESGTPADYRFVEINPAFSTQTGLDPERTVGKTALELIPDLEPFWIDTYGRVALTGEAFRFTDEAAAMGRWFDVYAFRIGGPESLRVAVLFNDITERRRTETALRDSEARYRSLFESIDEGFQVIEMVLDERGRPVNYAFLEINPAFAGQTGLEPEQTLGKLVLDVIPDLEPFWIETYGRVALTGEPTRFENEAAALGRWYDVYAFRVGGPGSYRVAAVFKDVTQRKEAEAALADLNATLEKRVAERTAELARSEQRFFQAFSAGPVAACITALNLKTVLEVNEAFSKLTGYSRDEAVGNGSDTLGLWSSPEEQERLERAAEAAGGARELELILRTKTGELRDVQLSAAVIRLEDHYGYLTMFYDVTGRKEAERWGSLLRGALDSAEESVVVTTADLDKPTIVYVNAAFSKMTGYKADEVLGRTPGMLQGPESDGLVWQRMRGELEKYRNAQGETVNYRKDGSTFMLSWNIAPICGDAGEVTHYVSMQRDVTRRRALERELLDLSAREQRRIVGDLNDSVQQQLVATALEAKRLAAMARQTDPALGAELDELVAHIQTGIRGVRAVLGDLTPVGPGDNGLMVALENLCLRVTTLFGVPCTFSFEQPLLVNDFSRAAHLFFIAQEAAINAAKHAAAGRIDVRLTGTPDRFTLSVSDDGSGVNDEVLRRYRGTGLRLMEGRAEILGAPLEVRSQPGRGTTVSISLAG